MLLNALFAQDLHQLLLEKTSPEEANKLRDICIVFNDFYGAEVFDENRAIRRVAHNVHIETAAGVKSSRFAFFACFMFQEFIAACFSNVY